MVIHFLKHNDDSKSLATEGSNKKGVGGAKLFYFDIHFVSTGYLNFLNLGLNYDTVDPGDDTFSDAIFPTSSFPFEFSFTFETTIYMSVCRVPLSVSHDLMHNYFLLRSPLMATFPLGLHHQRPHSANSPAPLATL